ncbi:hypothetical protein DXG03_006752 [Asterophora parasitica]|uniref:Uncharacterized protein n=1 Tax=Asterophora parasitica TaxID=117018 RepID=A0A9P7FZ03_9AGAR|nr:hypothetical protein DXG03_006752 [Asterophora parasitica]
MGRSSKTTFSYGFILKEAEIKKLLVALGQDSENKKEYDTLPRWISSKKSGLEPYFFSGEVKYDESDEGEFKEAEIAFTFEGDDDDELEVPNYELEVWGYDTSCRLFKPVGSPLANESFMTVENAAYEKINNTEAFKKAGITAVPQWFITLATG